jgi:hypothetical protein
LAVSDDEFRLLRMHHLLGAVRTCIQKGGNFLIGRLAPNGPIMKERCLQYVHKSTWGMYACGIDHRIISKMLDWTKKNALRPSGDFYFDDEPQEYKDQQRAYRALAFMKVAAWINHPLAKDSVVVNRLLQYQHKSGGVFNYIGDDPKRVEEQPTLGALNTSFFGHLMIGLNRKNEAIKAGDWICRLVEANRKYMAEEGEMFTCVTTDGTLETDMKPGEEYTKMVTNRQFKQEFWQVGTCMSYLATLYDKLRGSWKETASDAKRYLDDALTLLDYEATMPLETYLWPSKCKVAWGAGDLLRVLVKYGGSEEKIDRASKIGEKVALNTFIGNQLSNGGWSSMHYVLSSNEPALRYDYKPLFDLTCVPSPDMKIPGSNTIYLPAEEITGEFLGEMKAFEVGLASQLKYYEEKA